MKLEFKLDFPDGMPNGTAQMKGEAIRYKFVNGRKIPYIDHYRKPEVQALRNRLVYMMKRYKPEKPSDRPVKLTMFFFFDVKNKKLWGKYKTTKVDVDNFYKEIADVMTLCQFWNDDSQVVDLRLKKFYSEKASIFISMEELDDEPTGEQSE